MLASFRVANDHGAPAQARQELRLRLGEALDERDHRNLELLLSEVVTNAVRHSTGDHDVPIAVRVDVEPETIAVEIEDSGSGFVPATTPAPASIAEEHGYGLILLDRLSASWGVEVLESAFRVSFRLDRAVDAQSQPVPPRAA